jgi:hypothetical protein
MAGLDFYDRQSWLNRIRQVREDGHRRHLVKEARTSLHHVLHHRKMELQELTTEIMRLLEFGRSLDGYDRSHNFTPNDERLIPMNANLYLTLRGKANAAPEGDQKAALEAAYNAQVDISVAQLDAEIAKLEAKKTAELATKFPAA